MKVLVYYKTPCLSQKHQDPWAVNPKWHPYQMKAKESIKKEQAGFVELDRGDKEMI